MLVTTGLSSLKRQQYLMVKTRRSGDLILKSGKYLIFATTSSIKLD